MFIVKKQNKKISTSVPNDFENRIYDVMILYSNDFQIVGTRMDARHMFRVFTNRNIHHPSSIYECIRYCSGSQTFSSHDALLELSLVLWRLFFFLDNRNCSYYRNVFIGQTTVDGAAPL